MAFVPVSISVVILLSYLSFSFGDVGSNNPNDVLIKSINSAAGMELIPHGTKFQLTDFHETATESSVTFPNGGHGHVSGSVYTSKYDTSSAPVLGLEAAVSSCLLVSSLLIL